MDLQDRAAYEARATLAEQKIATLAQRLDELELSQKLRELQAKILTSELVHCKVQDDNVQLKADNKKLTADAKKAEYRIHHLMLTLTAYETQIEALGGPKRIAIAAAPVTAAVTEKVHFRFRNTHRNLSCELRVSTETGVVVKTIPDVSPNTEVEFSLSQGQYRVVAAYPPTFIFPFPCHEFLLAVPTQGTDNLLYGYRNSVSMHSTGQPDKPEDQVNRFPLPPVH